jgi:hypothetical protein
MHLELFVSFQGLAQLIALSSPTSGVEVAIRPFVLVPYRMVFLMTLSLVKFVSAQLYLKQQS